MGRYDFKAQRVHRAASMLLKTGRLASTPPWHDIVHTVPPPEILSRPLLRKVRGNVKKKSRMFVPLRLEYEEDDLRYEFFNDHPWELARPRVILENSGNDSKGWNWSRIMQKGKKLDGESVIQRQAWLMQHERLTKAQAYDKARKEFYRYRQMEDVERRVAQEEAIATGAYFGKSPLEIGMEQEDKWYENWRAWAEREIAIKKHAGAATVPSSISAPVDDSLAVDTAEEVVDGVEEGDREVAEEVTVPAR